jgi:hypothetical protein
MDLVSTPLYQYGAPMGTSLKLVESSKPVLTPGYELRPWLINMVQDKPFLVKYMKTPIPTYVSLSWPMHVYTLKAYQMRPYDGSFFLSLWQEKLNVGICSILGIAKEIRERCALAFAYNSFPPIG